MTVFRWSRSRAARWIPPGIGLVCCMAALWLYDVARTRDEEIVRQRTAVEAGQISDRIVDRIDNNARILTRYALRWLQRSGSRAVDWGSDATLIMAQDSAWHAMAWVDSELNTSWVIHRTVKNGVVPRNLSFAPGLVEALNRSWREEKPVVSHSLILPGGRRVIALCSPSTQRRVYRAMVGFLDVETVISQSLSGTADGLYRVTIHDGDSLLHHEGGPSIAGSPWYHEETVELGGAVWHVRITPEPDELARLHSDIPLLILAFGMSTGVLLALLTWLAQTARARAVEASLINSDLEREMEMRACVERAMRESEARFRSVTESANEAIVIGDEAGRIVFWNSAAERLFGINEDKALGRSVEVFIPERHRERYRSALEKAAAGWNGAESAVNGRSFEIEGLRQDRTEVPLEVSVSTWTFDARRFFSGIMRDISHRRATEAQIRKINAYLEARVKERTEELRRSNEELQQFAYVASHDLQEPLRVVASFTQLLARRYRGRLGPEADEFIAFAVDGCGRMQDLINDLLAYCRVGTTAAFAPVDCNRALEEALANLRLAIQESAALVRHKHLPFIHGDMRQIVQLFQNLIGNAIKFRRETPPVIDVEARFEDGLWHFSVRDNGIGMENRHLQRIFVIFQRLHTREEYKGTGIGLAICRKIVERHEGTIRAESEPGIGTTFHFTLPPAAENYIPIERLGTREASIGTVS